jgi:hypothetical protein
VPVLGLSTKVGVVNLNEARQLLECFVLRRGADAMAHVPSGFIRSHTNVPLHLESADSFLCLAHKKNYFKPLPQREVGVLEDRAGERGELMPVLLALLTLPLSLAG